MRGEICGVISNAEQDPGFAPVQPGHTQEVKAVEFRHTALLNWITVSIRDWQLD